MCRALPEVEIPAWALAGDLFCVMRTQDELSIVCEETVVPQQQEGLVVEAGCVALKLEGPFPFAMTGVLASFVQPLAEAEIPVFAISTFDTDYVLVKNANLKSALTALGAAGHRMIGGDDDQSLV